MSHEGAYPYAVVPTDESDQEINYDHKSSYRRDMVGSSLRYEHKGPRVELNSITGFHAFSGLQDIDQDFTPASLLSVTQDQTQQLLTQEIRINNAGEESRVDWIVGTYGFYQLNDQVVGVNYGDDGIALFNLPFASYAYQKNNDMTTYGTALFGQATLHDLIVPGISLTLGLRADYEKDALDYNYERYIDGGTVPTEDFTSGFDFFEILPKFSLQYKWSEKHMNYLSITRGYKSGGFNTTFEREEDQSFNPEYSWNYEAGWKGFINKRTSLSVSVFYIDWKDLQVYQPVPSGRGSMLKNAAHAASQGVELGLNIRPLQNWNITSNFGYTHALFKDYTPDPSETLNYEGNRVPYVPDLTGFIASSYRIPLGKTLLEDVVISAKWRQTGRIFWNDANEYVQDPYGLFGANITIGFSNFNVRIWGENILNQSYQAFQFTALGNLYSQPGRPRTLGMTFSYKL